MNTENLQILFLWHEYPSETQDMYSIYKILKIYMYWIQLKDIYLLK